MIAFLCHPYHRGGVTRWMVDMAIACAETMPVIFVTVSPVEVFVSGGGQETIISMLAGSKVRVVSAEVNWRFEFGTELYRATIYKKVLTANVPAGTPVILSDDFACWRVSQSTCAYKFIGVLHSDHNVYYDLVKKYVDSVDKFVCVSERIKGKAIQLCQEADRNDFTTIPCGINLPQMVRKKQSEGSILSLVYVGRITNFQKNVGDLYKIALKLRECNIPFHLDIIGDGPEKEGLEKSFEKDGFENVTFTGWLSGEVIHERLLSTDFLLLTSSSEGMPIAVMEGLSAGCGIISTRVSGVEDLEFHELAPGCLWLNEIGNTDEAVQNIVYATKNVKPVARENAARKLAELEFDMNTCIERYKAVIGSEGNKKLKIKKYTFLDEVCSLVLSFYRYYKLKISVNV